MENLIRKITNDIQYLYACIAYEDSSDEKRIMIKTESKLSKFYPIIKTVKGMTPIGEDYWGRFCFKDEKDQFYCELDGQLYFKGNNIDGEPHYPVKESIIYEFPEIDSDFLKFTENIEKVKKYFNESKGIELITYEVRKNIEEDISNSKILCSFEIELK